MKERPILFSGPMVRAILAGSKTQTRRVMRPQPPNGYFHESPDEVREPSDGDTPSWLVERCPHGAPGDRLWIKETIRRVAPVGRGCAWFVADDEPTAIDTWPWKRDVLTAIHCPRGASRLTLEITEVRVQRLQEISAADACDEGAASVLDPGHPLRSECYAKHGSWTGGEYDVDGPFAGAVDAFATLWDSINGKRAPWDSNPWVWALTFRRLP